MQVAHEQDEDLVVGNLGLSGEALRILSLLERGHRLVETHTGHAWWGAAGYDGHLRGCGFCCCTERA